MCVCVCVSVLQKRPESWRNVFIITAGISFIGAFLFAVFGSGEEQEWAKEKPSLPRSASGVTTHQNGGTSAAVDDYANIDVEIEIPEVGGHSFEKGKLNAAFVGETMDAGEEKKGTLP